MTKTGTNAVGANGVAQVPAVRTKGGRTNLFICFAPEEAAFARELDEALRKSRRVSAIKWKEVGATPGVALEVLRKIDAAETFVFIVSPASLASANCWRQLERAVQKGKVIVPVTRAAIGRAELPPALASAEVIDFGGGVSWEKAFEQVIAAVNTNLRVDVFLCYSRADRGFVERLYGEFVRQGRRVWFDFNNIPTSTVWEKEILSGIEASDNFVIVISPDSMCEGSYCHKEFAHAFANNKRIIPLYHREVGAGLVPPELGQFQRRDFPAAGDFDAYFQKVLADIDTDTVYVREHTRLLTRAREWQQGGSDRSLLLRGGDLSRAEALLRDLADKRPQFTNLQTQYVVASRAGANRTRNKLLAGVSIALVLTVLLAIISVFQTQAANVAKQDAVNQQKVAVEQREIAEAQRNIATQKQREAEDATREAKRQKTLADEQRDIAETKEQEAIKAAEAERKARELAEQRRREAEHQRQEAEIRGLRAEASGYEVANRRPEALALYRAAMHEEKRTGRRPSSYEVEQVAKRESMSRLIVRRDNPVALMSVSANGRTVATSEYASDEEKRQKIALWDVNSGASLPSIPAFRNWMVALAFSPGENGLLAAWGSDREGEATLKLWRVEDGKARPLRQVRGGAPNAGGGINTSLAGDFSFSDDGSLIAFGDHVYHVGTGKTVRLEAPEGFHVTSYTPSRKSSLMAATLKTPDTPGTFGMQAPAESPAIRVALFDALTGKLIRTLVPGEGAAEKTAYMNLVFSHDDAYVATADSTGRLRVWRTADGRYQQMQQPTRVKVRHLAFAPKSYQLVTTNSIYSPRVFLAEEASDASNGASLSIWDVSTGQPVRLEVRGRSVAGDTMFGMEGRHFVGGKVASSAFSEDGLRFATGEHDGTTQLWDAQVWMPLTSLPGHKNVVCKVEFIPGTRDLVTASFDGSARAWPLGEGRVSQRVSSHLLEAGPYMWPMKFSPDAGRLLMGRLVPSKPSAPGYRVNGLRFEIDGLEIYDKATGKLVSRLADSRPPFSHRQMNVKFSTDGGRVAYLQLVPSGLRGGKTGIKVWDAAKGVLLGAVKRDNNPRDGSCTANDPAVSGDLMTLAMVDCDQKGIEVRDVRTGGLLLHVRLDRDLGVPRLDYIRGMTFSTDGGWFAATFTGNSKEFLGLWRREGSAFVKVGQMLPQGRDCSNATFSHDSLTLVRACDNMSVRVIDLATLKTREFKGERTGSPHRFACASAADVCVITGDKSVPWTAWRPREGFTHARLIYQGESLGGLVISADGSRLITVHKETLRLWDTTSGRLIDSLAGYKSDDLDHIADQAFTGDSGVIAVTAGWRSAFRLWDAEPFARDPFLETGELFNLRVCRDSHKVVAVTPFPPPDTVWAPKYDCADGQGSR
ncbi:MAG: TIR domain-containing protein [Pyrinomonadaceae bacterium]